MAGRTTSSADKSIQEGSTSFESDEELAARGDNASFVTLYRRHLGAVYKYLYSRLGERQEAEDVTGQTFERAWAGLSSYKPTGAFKSWLFTLASHTLADHYRRTKRRPVLSGVEVADLVDSSPGPEEAALAAERLQLALSIIATLSEEQQEVIGLRFMAELPYKEIALVMGKREAAVKMIAYRALGEVRRRCADVNE